MGVRFKLIAEFAGLLSPFRLDASETKWATEPATLTRINGLVAPANRIHFCPAPFTTCGTKTKLSETQKRGKFISG
jgi:hypothetical protein